MAKTSTKWKKPIIVVAVIIFTAVGAFFLTRSPMSISDGDVLDVSLEGTDVSPNAASLLVSMINNSGKTRFPVGKDDRDELSYIARIDCSDGEYYILNYEYYSGYSFNPAHPGEDDYRSILTRYSADGEAQSACRMEYDFDSMFRSWIYLIREKGI